MPHLSEEEFFERFRFTKPTVRIILEQIENKIKCSLERNACLSPMQQLLLTLCFLQVVVCSFLLGDSGYRNSKYLLTPLLSTNDLAQELYNRCHMKSRNPVERQYGLWKKRFPILSLGMRVSTSLVKTVIVATAVLHNRNRYE
ncbi:hypothetical protein NQ314_001225 [Rhamnusium bicolor]|uniref:DDE Tnp4 domain-containing protein n=1 Tax=Rhamnusium bicolor TaxID=1586634 RepID=A0AAV8ZT41_9CUCU|nr:hypothetical protein NQ314_001225 [Rhamnusium bicolor]